MACFETLAYKQKEPQTCGKCSKHSDLQYVKTIDDESETRTLYTKKDGFTKYGRERLRYTPFFKIMEEARNETTNQNSD